MREFPVDRYLRAARRAADMSQRQLAAAAELPPHVVARIESSPDCARVGDFARLLGSAGFTLAVLDPMGRRLDPESPQDAQRRDRGRRRYPAHLDVRVGGPSWWGYYAPIFLGQVPEHTFDLSREHRDARRRWARERAQAAGNTGAQERQRAE